MRKANLLYLVGALVIVLGFMASPGVGWAAYGSYLSTVTSGGLSQPVKASVDPANGDVYVTDAGNKKVKKYSKNGVYDASFNLTVSGTPVGIAVSSANIFVGDDTNDCVWIYDKNGNLADLTYTGGCHKLGAVNGVKVKMPNTITIAPSDHIFVVDGDSDIVRIYCSTGLLEKSFGTSGTGLSSGTTIVLSYPTGLAVGQADPPSGGTVKQYFYIGDNGNYRIQKLYYVYNQTTKLITTSPTYVQNIGVSPGTRGDDFGYFLCISDIGWDSRFSRLGVVDSLQAVVQQYYTSNSTWPGAFDYVGTPGFDGAVLGNLKIPTGAAMNSTFSGKLFVVNNQADSLVLYDLAEGSPPSITALSPTSDTTPTASPYSISYTVTDSDETVSLTMRFYYYEASTPSATTLIGSTTVTLSGGSYSGTYPWSWAVLPGSAGNYYVVAEAVDSKSNVVQRTSAGKLIVSSNYGGCTNYTDAMKALYGEPTSDYDGDGISNCDELNGTNHTWPGDTYTSDMSLADTDGDGLTDGQEDDIHTSLCPTCICNYLNPRNPDTDSGGVTDGVELQAVTDPCNPADDTDVAPQAVGAPINVGTFNYDTYAEWQNTSNTITVRGDVVMRRMDGTIAAKTCISIPPNGIKVVKVKDYTSENNLSIDFVSVGAKYVVGMFECFLLNPYDGQVVDDYYDKMDLNGARKLDMDGVNFGNGRYKGWLCIKNPSVTNSVNIRVTYYTAAGSVSKVSEYTLPVLSAKIIEPNADEGLSIGQYTATIEGLNGNICGHFLQVRFNATDANLIDQAMAAPFEEEPANPLVWDTYNDGFARYAGWIGLKNPMDFPITTDVSHYTTAGVLAGTAAKTMLGHATAAWRPSVSDGIPGGQYVCKMYVTPTGLATVAVTAGGSGYAVGDLLPVTTSTGGVVKVTTVSSGVVTGMSIAAAGSGCSVGTAQATGANGLRTVAVTAGGSGYAVNNVLTVSGGTGGQVRVTSVSSGVVTGLKVESCAPGYGYTVGSGKATTGGSGTGCTVNVSAVTGSGCTVNVTAVNPDNAVMTGAAQYFRFNAAVPTATDFQLGMGLSRPSNSISTIAVTNGGSDYAVNDILNVSGGVNGQVKVTSVDGSGTVTGISVNAAGCGYSTGAGQTTTGGTGSGCTMNITGLNYGISAASVTAGGSGYAVDDILSVSSGIGGQVKVTSVSGGTVTGLSVAVPGTGYNKGAGQATTGGSGTGCTVNITALVYGDVTIYVPRWQYTGAGAGNYVTWIGVKNPDENNSVSLVCNFYDTGGNLIGSTSGGLSTVAVTAGGSGYTVNDILNLSGGTNGKVKVTTVSGGVVTGISVNTAGYGYSTGSGQATTGGTGTGCTVNVTAVTTTTLAAKGAFAFSPAAYVGSVTEGGARITATGPITGMLQRMKFNILDGTVNDSGGAAGLAPPPQ